MKVEKTSRFKFAVAVTASAVTLLVYFAALQNDFVNWDDGQYVFENPHIRSLNAAFFKWAFFDFYASNWHPLTWISHALDYALWGLNPLGHHLTSIVLHAINVFLVVLLVIRLLEAWKERAVRSGSPSFLNGQAILIAAGTTGLLFGLHPVHVESVAWVAERKDLLCALFFLLSLISYTNYARKTGAETPGKNTGSPFFNSRYLSVLGLFVLALMSKPMAVTLPVVLLVLDWFPFSRIRSGRTLWAACVEKLPFFALSLASSIVTIRAQKAGGTISTLEFLPLSVRALVGAKALVAYLWKMLVPVDLIPFYPYPKDVSLLSWKYLLFLILVIAVTVVCILAAKKRKLLLAAWGYYVVTLIPVLGIVQVGTQSMADRYTYLPSLGPFLLLGLMAAGAWGTVTTLKRPGYMKVACSAAAIFVFASLSYLTVKQIAVWENSVSLWSSVIEKEPKRVPFAYMNRGVAYQVIGKLDEALADFNAAILLNPSDAEAYNSRGLLFKQMGHPDAALEDYTISIMLNGFNAHVYNNRANVYGQMGQFDKELADYDRAITLDPSYTAAYNNRGMVFVKTGRFNRAIEDFNRFIALDPDNAEAYSNRGIAYALTGQYDAALKDFNAALALSQDFAEAYFNRGRLYSKEGRTELARADYQKACDLRYEKGCIALRER
jgi:lipoprotein NlpI